MSLSFDRLEDTPPPPLVTVVIVTRNRRNDNIECIQSVLDSDYLQLEVIMVDNGSKDDTLEVVREKFPSIRVMANRENLGLAEARNIGQRVANGAYILFLDSDTSIDSKMISELVSVLMNPRIAFSSPKMYSYSVPSRVWYAGALFSLISGRALNLGGLDVDVGQFEEMLTTSHAPTAFMVKKDIADMLGGHDNLFFMSYADSDFCIRMWKAGYLGVYVPKAVLYHKSHRHDAPDSLRAMGMNAPPRAYYYARNKVIFMKRHTSRAGFLVFLVVFFPIYHVVYTKMMLKNRGSIEYLIQYWKGVMDGVKYAFSSKLLSPSPK
ncbi:MAG TPA: glycosyltransferase family 2 protein [Candidatus Hodarchaeales archaeon]|nr:glycosyltransferase family 2 protein [Candidatus Hodarchaeales archaeon]